MLCNITRLYFSTDTLLLYIVFYSFGDTLSDKAKNFDTAHVQLVSLLYEFYEYPYV